MSEFVSGQYLSGDSSLTVAVRVGLDNGDLYVLDESGAELSRFRIKEVDVSPRLANVPRRVRFPDGTSFETIDNDGVDNWLVSTGSSGFGIHLLEGRKRFVFPFAVFAILFVWASISFGLPFLAEHAAKSLPEDVLDDAAESTLEFLDKVALEPTSLPSARRMEINSLVRSSFPMHAGLRWNLVFRSGGSLGANAFALPNGTIVFTDELVELLESDEEILAVFAHELGHVVGRHSLRQVFQDAGIAVLSFLIIGEATDVLQEALNVLPAALMHNAYSREFEREADDYAIKLLREAGIPSKRLGDALHRLTEQHGGDEGIKYFSSHPPTKERIEKAKEADK